MPSFEIPNAADATDVKQSQVDAVDWAEMNRGYTGIISTSADVTANAAANTVDVPTITYAIDGQVYTIAATTLTLQTPSGGAWDTDEEAFDLVVANTSSAYVAVAGTPAAATGVVFPTVSSTQVLVAAVWREQGRTAIVNGDIMQKQVGYQLAGDLTGDIYTTDTAGTARRIYGGRADGDHLELQGNSNDATDSIHLYSPIVMLPSGRTFTTAPATPTLGIEFEAADTIKLDYASTDLTVLRMSSAVEIAQAHALFAGPKLFWVNSVVKNEDGTTINNAGANTWTMVDQIHFQAVNANHTLGFDYGFQHSPQLTGSGGTMTVTQIRSVQSVLTLNAGSTVTTRTGVYVKDATNSGTLTNQVGVWLEDLDAGTNGVGVLEGQATVPTISGGGVYGGYFNNYLRVPTYTDGNRGTASNFAAGTMIFNTTSGVPEWSDGTNWITAAGATT